MSLIVTFNVGSATLKAAAYDSASGSLLRTLALELKQQPLPAVELAQQFLASLQQDGFQVLACAHRVVHGGQFYREPALIDDHALQQLHSLSVLCPLHQPPALAVIEHLRAQQPALRHIAAFDTAFHSHQPALASTYALPAALREAGVRAYGFHGLSCQSLMCQLQAQDPRLARQRILIAHLGSGASLTAVQNGISIGNSMGFSALEGLAMGTRSGHLDPGVLLYLIDQGWSGSQISDTLYKQSGLLGLAGSSDMRELLARDDDDARFAVDYFCYRIAREASSLIAAMQGIDRLVFSGGIGEHSEAVREKILRRLQWLQQVMPFAVQVIESDEQCELYLAARQVCDLQACNESPAE